MLLSNKNSKADRGSEIHKRIIKAIVLYFNRWQTKWAEWMRQKAERLSRKGKIKMLLLFCGLAGTYSIYLITSRFSGKHVLPFSVTSIKPPALIQRSDEENRKTSATISKEAYQKMQRFKGYMDSLARSPSGKTMHDSILTAHPHLMDSIALFENIYQSQIKTE